MSTDSSPNVDQLKKCLKDAGVFEENMNYDDMLAYYNAIKSSENTAQQEEEKRHVNENDVSTCNSSNAENEVPGATFSSYIEDAIVSDEEEITASQSPTLNDSKQNMPKTSKSKFSLLKSESASKANNSKRVKLEEYDAFGCPPLKHKPLDIIFYERKYEVPAYCNPKYSKLSTPQRAKFIREFHRTILMRYNKLQRESLNPVPWGKPIPASEKVQGSLKKKSEEDFEFEEESSQSQEIYTSRFGRQTKRKLYTDVLEDDADFKKTKKNEDKPFEIEKKPIIKRQNSNKLSNQDIMKRSKLFAEPVKTTQCEKLFDLLKQDGDKEKDTGDQCVENVNGKSKVGSDESEVDIVPNSPISEDELKPKELNFVPRRIPPPLRGRRGIGNRRQQSSDTSKSKTNFFSSPGSSTTVKTQSPLLPSNTSSNDQKSALEKTNCPICSKTFLQDEIEAHASSCGLLMETESNFDVLRPGSNSKKMKCSICDKEMLINKEYELHVNECIKKATKSNSPSP